MNIFLDSNVCIGVMNGNASIRRHFDVRSGDSLFVSTIVVFELRFGIEKSARVTQNMKSLSVFLDMVDVLPFDADDAAVAGRIRAQLRGKGKPIGAYDVLIAAPALRRDWLLVTANTREFDRVSGLRLENWEI